jgi:hypothetical protein
MIKARVFLDTNVFKSSATKLPRARPREVTINWSGKEEHLTVYDLITVNPNENLPEKSAPLKAEAALLPQVAGLAAAGLVLFQLSIETQVELSGLPNLDSETGFFYGAETQIVSAPARYGRVLYGEIEDYSQAQEKFLGSLHDKRFLELQKITGAYQGKRGIQRNQLLDAFHLWCAEHSKCDFFLSLDFKLAKVTKGRVPVLVVRPSELLAAVRGRFATT